MFKPLSKYFASIYVVDMCFGNLWLQILIILFFLLQIFRRADKNGEFLYNQIKLQRDPYFYNILCSLKSMEELCSSFYSCFMCPQ